MRGLHEAPPLDDLGAFEAWREALVASTFARGELRGAERGLKEGEERGLKERRAEAKRQAVLTILVARGFSVPEELRRRIVECTDPVTRGRRRWAK